MTLNTILKVGKKLGVQALKSSISGMVFSVDSQTNSLVLRDFAICKLLHHTVKKKGITDITKVFFQNKKICIQHEKYGIIGINLKSIIINKEETKIVFDTNIIQDKLSSERDKEIINSIIKTTAGGIISFCSFGFLGGRLMYDGITEGFKSNSNYQKNKASFIGENQTYSIKSLVDFDTSGKLINFLETIGGSLTLTTKTDLHNLHLTSNQLTPEKLIEIKNNFIENTKGLIEQSTKEDLLSESNQNIDTQP